MNDPFVAVALQFTLLFAVVSIVAWYVILGVSAIVWSLASYSKRQVTELAVRSREQVASLSQPAPAVQFTKKVKVAYK